MFNNIIETIKELYINDPRPWIVGFSGGKDSTMVALLVFSSILSVPPNGECPIQIDTSTPSCGNSRFGCWTCTVVDRDKASEGLFAAGDERMERLIEFRETLLFYRDPANGKRDMKRMNGNDGPGPLHIEARRELLSNLLILQEEIGLSLISTEELLLIQQMWKAARNTDDGREVARIINKQRGVVMDADLSELNSLRELEEEIALELGVKADTLRRMLAKVEEYGESHRAYGLPDGLLNILKDDLITSNVSPKTTTLFS